MLVNKPRLVRLLDLNGWEGGEFFLDQSRDEEKQNWLKLEITFDFSAP